jgi:hypothetical protein
MRTPWLPAHSRPARCGALCCPRAGAAVSSCAVPRHASRAISTLLHPPGAHRCLCNRPGHLPDGAKIHPAV